VRHNRAAVGRRTWAEVADGYLRVFGEAIEAARGDAVASGHRAPA
jgi:hypothetical protein